MDLSKYKLISLAPYIHNRPNYYNRDHPEYHPDTDAYDRYWTNEEKKCIEGLFVLDQPGKLPTDTYDKDLPGGYRFLVGQHYFYITYTFIQHLPDPDSSPVTMLPDLRDIDLYWFYVWIVASGFSGFTDDEHYSCHYLLKRYENSKKPNSTETFGLTPKEKQAWLRAQPNLLRSDGTYKTYIDPITYLKKTFSKPLGSVLYQNPLKNVADLEARGGGKTYRAIAIALHTFTFFGARTYEEYINIKKGPTICVGSALSAKSGALLQKMEFTKNEFISNFGAWDDGTTFIPGYFHRETSGVISSGNEKNPYRHEYKIQRNGVWKKNGTKTSIIHQSYKDNPEVFVGNRSKVMIEDEFGLNEKAVDCAKADNKVMIMDGIKMGIALKTGTGGNILKVQGAKEIFYNPDSFGYLRFEDEFEGAVNGICLFIPSYYVDGSFRDPNGNQNIELAFEQELHNRQLLIDSGNLAMLDAHIVDNPIVPSEMFLSPEVNIFPTAAIREHLAQLERDRVVDKIVSLGDLEFTDSTETSCYFVPVIDRYRPHIKSYDLKKYEGHHKGVIAIYEHPIENIPDPLYKYSLYKIGVDPVKDDNGGISLYAITVYKGSTIQGWNEGIQNNIVATYIGRWDDVEMTHEIVIRLAIYYNARVLPEIEIPDILRYIKRRKKIFILQPRPLESISKAVNEPTRKYVYGMEMSKPIKIQAEQLTNKWLNEKKGIDENGKIILNLHGIYDERILNELLIYDRTKNTDAIITLFLIMMWLHQEELVPYAPKDLTKKRDVMREYLENKKRESVNSLELNSYFNM